MSVLRKEGMTMLGPIVATAMLLGTAVAPIQVDVGRADWNALPPLKAAHRDLPTPATVGRVQEMLVTGTCSLPRQRAAKFDITVPYAVPIEPDGRAQHVVVAETDCPVLETYVGTLVTAMAGRSDFKPIGEAKVRWVASALNFNLR